MSSFQILLFQGVILSYAFVGGVFLAFSDFIMRALARTSGTGGVEAMQVINREVFRWVFMALFLGLAVLSLVLMIYAALALQGPGRALVALAGLTYWVGCFGVTVLRNVPMNEALKDMDRSDTATAEFWTDTYLPRWTFWNTVRTGACAAAAVMLQVSLPYLP